MTQKISNLADPKRCECGGWSRVIDSRSNGALLRRRRVCKKCAARWSTYETRMKAIRIDRIIGAIKSATHELNKAAETVEVEAAVRQTL